MSTRLKIPQSAENMKYLEGTINKNGNPDLLGREVKVSIQKAYQSRGYHTNFEPIPVYYLTILINGNRAEKFAFSGKRIAKCFKEFEGAKQYLDITKEVTL